MGKLQIKNDLKEGHFLDFLEGEVNCYNYGINLSLASDIKEIKLVNAFVESAEAIEDSVVYSSGYYFDTDYGNYLPNEEVSDVFYLGKAIIICEVEILLEDGIKLEIDFIQPFQYIDSNEEKYFENESDVFEFYEMLLEEEYVS